MGNRILLILVMVFGTPIFAADNLNLDPTLNLIQEISVPDVRKKAEDTFELSYGQRNWGKPWIFTKLQNTQYDFQNRQTITFAHERLLWPKYHLGTLARVSYFDVQELNTAAYPTRLHVLPAHIELAWRMSYKNLSPFLSAGIGSVIQVQRGVELLQSTESAGIWIGRLGLDWHFSQALGIRASYFGQTTWDNKNSAWNGSAYDAGLTFSL
jgi:hypothetical protein